MNLDLARVNRHVGDRLRVLRLKCGLARKDVGLMLGVSHQQVRKYEDGSDRLSAGALLILSRALAVDLHFFFDGFAEMMAVGELRDGPAPAYLPETASPVEGHRLDAAFARIRSQRLRSLAIRLVEAVASDEQGEPEHRREESTEATVEPETTSGD